MRVVILGAGFGGLELATLLSQEFGRASEKHVVHRYVDMVLPGVSFVQSTVRTLDPVAR